MTNRLTALKNRPSVFTAVALLAVLALVAVGESQQTHPRTVGGVTVQLPPDAPTKPPLLSGRLPLSAK